MSPLRLFLKSTNLIQEESTLKIQSTPVIRNMSLNTIDLILRISMCDFGGDTNMLTVQ